MNQAIAALSGLIVVERAGRLSTAVCGNLLASLGAQVVRVHTEAGLRGAKTAPPARQLVTLAGKTILVRDGGEIGGQLLETADVVLLDMPSPQASDRACVDGLIRSDPGAKVICVISPLGLEEIEALTAQLGEPGLQALSGVAATTGSEGGAPQCIGVPIAEMCAGLTSATAVLAALGVRASSGRGQLVDMSIVEVMADQMRTHFPLVMAGTGRGFRLGCQHPVSSPWNCYQAKDKSVFICTGTEAQWHATADLLGCPELKQDPRFASRFIRRKYADVLNGILSTWVAHRSADEVIAAFLKLGIPAGRALTVPELLQDKDLVTRGMVAEGLLPGGKKGFLPGSVLHLTRTPGVAPTTIAPPVSDTELALPTRFGALPAPLSAPELPLVGVRVVELSRYVAGPLCGALLASLGAEVVKIEPPEGEDCRDWPPLFSGVSGYFANYNIGKRSVALDLRSQAGRDALSTLLESADVVLQNYKPGGLERMGFGVAPVLQRSPRIIYCSISGYGSDGATSPALDTVLQGEGALTSLIGDGSQVLRVGFSMADMVSGQFAALGILAALAERQRSGSGQAVDISMRDAIVWLTQLAWPDGDLPVNSWAVHAVRDGWVVAEADRTTTDGILTSLETANLSAHELITRLREAGIQAVRVLELDEVMELNEASRRSTLYRVKTAHGEPIPLLAMALGLRGTPPLRHVHLAGLGEDNQILLGEGGESWQSVQGGAEVRK